MLDDLTKPSKEQQAEQHQMIAEAIADRYPHGILNSLKENNASTKTNAHNVLMGAIVIGNLPLVKTLLEEQQADVNVFNPYFGQPLEIAAVRGHLQIVLYLLDCGADPCRDDNGEDWNGFDRRLPISAISALGAAVRGGHDNVVQLLMKPEYSPSPAKAEYFRVIVDGVKFGRLHFVQSLLQATGKQISDFGKFGDLMFYTAVVNDQPDIVQVLLDGGIDVNMALHDPSHRLSIPMLCRAASRGNPRMVRILLDHGAIVDSGGNADMYYESWLPIARAARLGHEEVVDLILAHSTDPKSLETAFICAAEGGQTHLMNKLWKKDSQLHTKPWPHPINLRCTVGVEALYRAIIQKSPAVISLLAEHGVSLNEKYFEKCLMVIARFESARWIADFMVSLGAEDVDGDRFTNYTHRGDGRVTMRAGVYIKKQNWEWGSKY